MASSTSVRSDQSQLLFEMDQDKLSFIVCNNMCAGQEIVHSCLTESLANVNNESFLSLTDKRFTF